MNICPVCHSWINDASIRQLCKSCGNGDRTRTLCLLYSHLKPITIKRDALIITTENWLDRSLFENTETSIYLGKNHLDIQQIDRPNESYGWISCNHVLEHVKKDVSALTELYRILKHDGVMQLTVPTPARTQKTKDWGFADPNIMGHYRNYGSDFIKHLSVTLPAAYILCVFATDIISPFSDVVFFIFKEETVRHELADTLFKTNIPSIPIG